MPIIELQRRAVEAGRIRAGDRGPKGEPRKIANWRLTSKDRERLEAAAALWGGTVQEWDDQFELYTETDVLPIMLLPGQAPSTWYELWTKGGCQRRCDGVHEVISDKSCLCGDERECKPITRLSVLLPDVPGLGSWLLSSTGWNAAAELAGSAELLGRASSQGVLLPARLRLDQRVDVKAGQTRRYAVPVLEIDSTFRELMSLGGVPELAPARGYTPLALEPGGNGVSVAKALEVTENQKVQRTSRSAAEIPRADDSDEFDDAPPIAVVDEDPGATSTGSVQSEVATLSPVAPLDDLLERDKPATDAMKRKLDALVGQLRDGRQIQTEHLWVAIATERARAVEDLITELGGRDDERLSTGRHFANHLLARSRARCPIGSGRSGRRRRRTAREHARRLAPHRRRHSSTLWAFWLALGWTFDLIERAMAECRCGRHFINPSCPKHGWDA